MKPGDDLCDACGYHLILKKVIDISDMKQPAKSTGFERMLESQLNESESSRSTLLWMKVVACFLLVGFFFLCLGRWWWIGVLVAGAGIAWYWMAHRRRTSPEGAGSAVNADPLSDLLWSLLLALQRAVGWRRLEWPFPKARSLTLRDPQLTDDELAEWEGLDQTEALDLESAGISDQGLESLRGLKQLRFLVLRNTRVTPSGVVRLQSDLPQVHIWH